ncbi:MAG: response regulator [Sulfuricellaceae bacterium]|nr:response regulator [Sulfuricellaceae bacterium]
MKVLVVDDDFLTREYLSDLLLATEKYEVESAENGLEAFNRLQADQSIELVISDMNMPVMDGLALIKRARQEGMTQPIIVMSGNNEISIAIEAINSGANDYLVKDENVQDTISLAVERVLEKKKIQDENRQLLVKIQERTLELEKALHHVHDSIQYASYIQKSLMPPAGRFDSIVSEHFVLWEPRDVVGGDIYWCRPWGEGSLVILGDCTGHGVPGAFMTLISAGALEIVIREVMPGDVGGFIQLMNRIVQNMLHQDASDGYSDDGLELGVCYLTGDKSRLYFSGARFELFYTEDGVASIIKGTKKGIGYRGIPLTQEYETHEVEVRPGMVFYMATDGILDQIGGDKGFSFGKGRFKKLIEDAYLLPLEQQRAFMLNTLISYQGEEQRRDDVSVIGFKI